MTNACVFVKCTMFNMKSMYMYVCIHARVVYVGDYNNSTSLNISVFDSSEPNRFVGCILFSFLFL